MTRLNPAKSGVALGLLFGGFHLGWAALVALGWAGPILNFVFWAHMITNPYVVEPFDFAAALALIIVTTITGYVLGYCFARIWNRTHRL